MPLRTPKSALWLLATAGAVSGGSVAAAAMVASSHQASPPPPVAVLSAPTPADGRATVRPPAPAGRQEVNVVTPSLPVIQIGPIPTSLPQPSAPFDSARESGQPVVAQTTTEPHRSSPSADPNAETSTSRPVTPSSEPSVAPPTSPPTTTRTTRTTVSESSGASGDR